jgi:hypothetical protein
VQTKVSNPASYESTVYTGCGAAAAGSTGSKAEVQLVALPGVGHTPYKGIDTGVDTTELCWKFVKRFPAAGTAGNGTTPGEMKPDNNGGAGSSSMSGAVRAVRSSGTTLFSIVSMGVCLCAWQSLQH